MAEIKVAKVTSGVSKKATRRELYAQVCLYYPQYTLKEASLLPARDLYLLIGEAYKREALRNYNMMQIVAAPHSKKGEAIGKLLDHFKENMRGK